MKISEVIRLRNEEKKTASEVAKKLNCSVDLLRSILNDHNYKYDNSKKLYVYKGKGNPEEIGEIDILPIIQERKERQNYKRDNSTNKVNKVEKKSDLNQTINEKKSELKLTEDEILFLKRLIKEQENQSKESDLNHDLSLLPPRKPSKKTSYEISTETYKRFEAFAATITDQHRMSKNDLVEIAFMRLIKEFS